MTTNLSWITNLQNSIYYAVSGWLTSSSENTYVINNLGQTNNIQLKKGYPVAPETISDNTISISLSTTPDINFENQLGNEGWTYNLNITFDVFGESDRQVKILLYEISKFTRRELTMYDWDVVATGGSGLLGSFGVFDRPITRIVKNTKTSANTYLQHRGRSTVLANIDTDNLELI